MELMIAAIGQEHLHLARGLVGIRKLSHAVDAVVRLKGTHVDVRLSLFLLFHRIVVSSSGRLHSASGCHAHSWVSSDWWQLLHDWSWQRMLWTSCHSTIALSLHYNLLLTCEMLLDVRSETCQQGVQAHLCLVALQSVRVLTGVMFQSHERL